MRSSVRTCTTPELPAAPHRSAASRGLNEIDQKQKFLHEFRQREWLRSKAKQQYIDFSDEERAELRRYFDSLCGDESDKIHLERLETMLISVGLASTSKEVKALVQAIDLDGNGELDFEEYLAIFRSRSNSEMLEVFKAMMKGRLGDPRLNFENVVSTYRRQLFLEATGATTGRGVRLPADKEKPEKCETIMQNYTNLQKSRHEEALKEGRGGLGAAASDKALYAPFEGYVCAPLGSLRMIWRQVAKEHDIGPAHTLHDDADRFGVIKSPVDLINEICSPSRKIRPAERFGATVMVPAAPADQEVATMARARTGH